MFDLYMYLKKERLLYFDGVNIFEFFVIKKFYNISVIFLKVCIFILIFLKKEFYVFW